MAAQWWSGPTKPTQYYGRIEAKGGAVEGDGGKVEVSSHGLLGFGGDVDVSATAGASGSLLLDPKDVEIVAGGGSGGSSTTTLPLTYANPLAMTSIAVARSGTLQQRYVHRKNRRCQLKRQYAASKAGAVRLYTMSDGSLFSTLTGSTANDSVGSYLGELGNGHFYTYSSTWITARKPRPGPSPGERHNGKAF